MYPEYPCESFVAPHGSPYPRGWNYVQLAWT